jgi:DNA-binding MarR family transcriptional regulator
MAGRVPPRTREATLRAALRDAVRGSPPSSAVSLSAAASRDREQRRHLADLWRVEAADFVRGIVDTARLIEAACASNGERVFRTDPRYKLLAALERIGGWPSISELARELGVSRQAARQQFVAAARGSLLDLVPDPYDRRAIQIGLSPAGRRELGAARVRELVLVTTLLGGLADRHMRLVAHVLRVLRARLLRVGHEQTAARPPSLAGMGASPGPESR